MSLRLILDGKQDFLFKVAASSNRIKKIAIKDFTTLKDLYGKTSTIFIMTEEGVVCTFKLKGEKEFTDNGGNLYYSDPLKLTLNSWSKKRSDYINQRILELRKSIEKSEKEIKELHSELDYEFPKSIEEQNKLEGYKKEYLELLKY